MKTVRIKRSQFYDNLVNGDFEQMIKDDIKKYTDLNTHTYLCKNTYSCKNLGSDRSVVGLDITDFCVRFNDIIGLIKEYDSESKEFVIDIINNEYYNMIEKNESLSVKFGILGIRTVDNKINVDRIARYYV